MAYDLLNIQLRNPSTTQFVHQITERGKPFIGYLIRYKVEIGLVFMASIYRSGNNRPTYLHI